MSSTPRRPATRQPRQLKVLVGLGGLAVALIVVTLIRGGARGPPSPPTDRPPVSGSRAPDSETALDSLLSLGETRYWEGAFAEARLVWEDALARSRRLGNRRNEARVLTWLGLVAFRTGDYEQARRLGESALELKLALGPGVELPKSYNALGLLAWSEGRLSAAAGLFEQAASSAAAEGDEETAAKAANNLGLVYSDLGEFASARSGFEASLEAGRRLGDRLIEGRTLNNLGMLEIKTGDPTAGLRLLEEARRSYRSSEDITGELNALGQLATAYLGLGEPRRAFALLDTALVLARRHGLRSEEASALEWLGELYREAGDHRRALELYEQARRLNRELGLTIEEGADLSRAAAVHAALGDYEAARELARQAAALHEESGAAVEALADLLLLAELGQLTGSASETRADLERARRLAARLDSRSVRIDIALAEARIADREADAGRVLEILAAAAPEISDGSYRVVWEAEMLRARASARLGDLEEAAAAGYRAVEAVEKVRDRLGSGWLRTALVADRQVAYTDLIDALLKLGRVEDAFEVADAARGRSFLEHLASVPRAETRQDAALEVAAEAERLLGEIDELLVRRDEIEMLPDEERDHESDLRIRELSEKLRETRGQYEELHLRLEERDAQAGSLIGGQRVRSAEVRAALRPDETLLEFVVSPDWAIVFAATRDRVEAFAVAVPAADVIRQARIARELAGQVTSGLSATEVLERLHVTLIEPLVGNSALVDARRLIIVPDAALGHVPFAALRDAEAGRYLVERYAISYLPTAGALPLLRSAGAGTAAAGTLTATVFAPLPEDLPATRREAETIRAVLRGTKLITGRRATEESLRRELASGRVVHVASHGVLERSNPLFSRVELARGANGPSNDGRFELHEILDVTIRSPLVFLSGCETETGPARSSTFAGGDDYATLARAFLYAGARSVIATLWRIDDEGAAEFAGRFYERLRGSDADAALAAAQREMIASERFSAPYYWAAYRLAGETLPARDPAGAAGR